jgi:recombination protein RecR
MYPPSIQKLIDEFSKFPTVGARTAARFAFYLMGQTRAETEALAAALMNLKKNVKTCRLCFNVYESEKEICGVCADPKRDKSLLCVVANETDLAAMEKLKAYKGLYFVLGGTISSLKKESLAARRVSELEKRVVANRALKEIILAINPTSEGSGTILHLERCLKPFNVRVTKLGLGLPVGGELEYADEETLSSALNGRK